MNLRRLTILWVIVAPAWVIAYLYGHFVSTDDWVFLVGSGVVCLLVCVGIPWAAWPAKKYEGPQTRQLDDQEIQEWLGGETDVHL